MASGDLYALLKDGVKERRKLLPFERDLGQVFQGFITFA